MFGSNFDANFGIPAFPFDGMDPQGGMLGTNVQPPAGQPAPAAPPAAAAPPSGPTPAAPPAPGAPSPLGGGVLAPGGAQQQPAPTDSAQGQAPAAGIGSPFGKAGV